MLLTSDYIALLACLGLSALLIAGVLSRPRWSQALAYTVAVAIFVVHVLGARLDYVWAWLLPHPSVVVVSLVAVWGPLIAILLGLARHLPKQRDRRALYVIAALVGGYGCYALGRQLFVPPVQPESWWQGEVLMQSTSSTCIAAASATYLRTMGVDIDELQAARLGLISADGGDQLSAWRILRLSLPPDYVVRIAPLDRAAVEAEPRWLLTGLHYSFNEGHEVLVRPRDDGRLAVRDPIAGEYDKTWDEFEAQWLGCCVWAAPRR
jgi:hypothetical protein